MNQVISHTSNPKLDEMKVVYRHERKEEIPPYRNACDLVTYLRTIWNDDTIDLREELILICLSGSYEIKGWVRLSEGGIEWAQVDPRILFGILLVTASVSFILVHNHPSGDPLPSPNDRYLTGILSQGAELLGLRLTDHIIITRTGHHSMCDNGQLP